MSIRIGLCRFLSLFFLLSFWFWSVLLCWAGRVGRGGLEEWEGWMGLEGEVVYYWQNGSFVAIWRKRERSNSKKIKQTRKTHSYRQTRLAATKQCPLDNKSDVRAKKK